MFDDSAQPPGRRARGPAWLGSRQLLDRPTDFLVCLQLLVLEACPPHGSTDQQMASLLWTFELFFRGIGWDFEFAASSEEDPWVFHRRRLPESLPVPLPAAAMACEALWAAIALRSLIRAGEPLDDVLRRTLAVAVAYKRIHRRTRPPDVAVMPSLAAVEDAHLAAQECLEQVITTLGLELPEA